MHDTAYEEVSKCMWKGAGTCILWVQATVSWTSQNDVLALVFHVMLGNFMKEPKTQLFSSFIDKADWGTGVPSWTETQSL